MAICYICFCVSSYVILHVTQLASHPPQKDHVILSFYHLGILKMTTMEIIRKHVLDKVAQLCVLDASNQGMQHEMWSVG